MTSNRFGNQQVPANASTASIGNVKVTWGKEVPRDLPKVNILLFGGVGAGKSSLISSVDSLFKGRISRRAAHGQGTGSYTRLLNRFSFKLNPSQGSAAEAPFALWDCAGWTDREYQAGELGYILDGNVPHGFDLSQPIHPQSRDFFAYPALADKVHCVCFVVPSSSASDQEYTTRLKQMKKFAMDRGIPTLVFLTKVDEYDPGLRTNGVSTVFSSARIASIMAEVATLSGSGGTKDVFPMKSFSNEYEPTADVSILIMRGLQHALYAAQDFLEDIPVGPSSGAAWKPASAPAASPMPQAQPATRTQGAGASSSRQGQPAEQPPSNDSAVRECRRLIAECRERLAQADANPFTTVEKLQAVLASWDEQYHSTSSVCTIKWQLRNRFINDYFTPLVHKVQERRAATEAAVQEAARRRHLEREAAEQHEAAAAARRKEAAEKQERDAIAAEQRERNAVVAAARAAEAEVVAKRARESEAAAKQALEAEAAAGRARQAEADRQHLEAKAAAKFAADAAAAAQRALNNEAAARAALEIKAQQNLAEAQRQQNAAALAAKRAADAETAANAARQSEAAARSAREQDAAAHRAREAEAEKQRRDAELDARRAREAEANAKRALEAEVAARAARESEAAAKEALAAEVAARRAREAEAAAKAARDVEIAAMKEREGEAQRRMQELALQAEHHRQAAEMEKRERAELERQKNATAGFSELLAGGELREGQSMTSPDGRSRFAFQDDGNLVVYRDGAALWATNTSTARPKPAKLAVQDDGNLVLYAADGRFAGWASNTDKKGDSQTRLMLQNGGVLVLRHSSGRTLWTSAPQLRLADGITAAVKVMAKFHELSK